VSNFHRADLLGRRHLITGARPYASSDAAFQRLQIRAKPLRWLRFRGSKCAPDADLAALLDLSRETLFFGNGRAPSPTVSLEARPPANHSKACSTRHSPTPGQTAPACWRGHRCCPARSAETGSSGSGIRTARLHHIDLASGSTTP